jgi:glycosyltransferase involved in cell wall biosynthesis
MKIAYVTTYNAADVHNWSGLAFHLAKALTDQQTELQYIGDLGIRNEKALKLKRLLYRSLGQRFLIERNFSVARGYARQITRRIAADADCIFSPGSVSLACLDSNKPKAFYTDATFAGMVGFYDAFSGLAAESIKKGNRLEQAALDTCSLAIYSSDWAAKTAMDNYDVSPQKIRVLPFGANIENDRSYDDIKKIIRTRSKTVCRLLWLGVDWVRKGGDLAVQITKQLNEAGLRTELHIAGMRSLPPMDMPDQVIDHGFISKSTLGGRTKIEDLIAQSHFLILPTKAEAYGLVFCEANSFGVPNIATNVGGIPTIVKDHLNGRLFSVSASAGDYANYILQLFTDYDEYERLALSSFNEFQQRLNWNVSGKRLADLLKTL